MPLPRLGGLGAGLGGLATVLGLGFEGYAKDQARRVEEERNRQRDATEAQLVAAQMANYKSQADDRKAKSDQEKLERDTLGQYGAAAAGGDKGAQMKITAVFGSRAPAIMKEWRELNNPEKHRQYSEDRGAIIDVDTGIATPVTNLPPGKPRAPVMGTPEYLDALDAAEKIRAKYRTTGGAGGEETPEIRASRRDLKDIAEQQRRAEHDVSVAKSDLRNLTTQHPRAALPLPLQRTAADSAYAGQYATIAGDLSGAEARKKRLTTSADSTRAVIAQLRGRGVLPPAPDQATPAPAAPMSPTQIARRLQRATQENAGFNEAIARIRATVRDPAEQQRRIQEAKRIFTSRIEKVNAGGDPDE